LSLPWQVEHWHHKGLQTSHLESNNSIFAIGLIDIVHALLLKQSNTRVAQAAPVSGASAVRCAPLKVPEL
jgi:hypothetical protein